MSHRAGLVLDFGGVLTTPLLPAVLNFEQREGLAEGACITGLYLDEEGTRRTHELERGAITQDQWNEAAGARLGVAPDNLMGRIFADLRPEPLMINAAAAARRAGIKVGIVSNSVGLAPWNLYDGYDLDALYDAVVISEHHGMRKPDPEIFQAALKLLELPAEQCVFVDDTADHLPAAADLGFATLHAKAPWQTISQLEDLLEVSLTEEV
ncbi:HAD-IA family hydrolase [Streptomyces sp. NBC_01483]|uniref:HAD-IA family hydrolase n=1 Tax=Streptomyces sp. NBC_01483 TaxID=2903883 RepID=UPI002E3567EF|nr:HAD-IA family hydrolase [Streptomyces sp. NBC_01483]